MKTRHIIALAVAALCFPTGAMADGKVHIKGQLTDMGSTEVAMTFSEAAALIGDSRDIMLHTDAEGRFDTTIVLDRPTYYSICRNTLYLTPGDDLTMHITTNNQEATFTGRGAEVNEYMKYRLFPKGGSFLEGGSNLKADFAATRKNILELAAARRKQLTALKTASTTFKQLEGARITADVLNSYLCYPSYANLTSGLKTREEMRAKMQEFYKSFSSEAKTLYKQVAKDDMLDVAVVRDVMSYIVEPDGDIFKDWASAVTITPRMKELYGAADKVNSLRSHVDEKKLEEVIAYSKALANRDFAAEVDAKVKQAQKLLKGSPAIDFTFTDTDGNTHRLSDFKGKAIYLDFWATWCGPCIQESPHFESLAKEYAGKDIVFIPISTDTSKKAWLSFIKAHKKELKQYNTVDETIRSEWAIFYIPRFVVIDKDFRIVDSYAPRPSEEAAKRLLDSIL